MPRPHSALPFAIFLAMSPYLTTSDAQGNECSEVDDFYTANATGTYTMPALSINHTEESDPELQGTVGGLVASSSDYWVLSPRANAKSQNPLTSDLQNSPMWLNTGDSNLTDIGFCMTQSVSYGFPSEYFFSKDVMLRSADDNGDCKTMLGNECVAALQAQYQREASKSMYTGECPGTGNGGINNTIPYQCQDLVGGGESWLGGFLRSGGSLSEDSYTASALANSSCSNDTQPLNASMHALSHTITDYNQTIRFPDLWFLTFWPDRSSYTSTALGGGETSWEDDVHVEIRCLKAGDVVQRSYVPPSAQDLLDHGNATFAKNVSGDQGTSGKGSGAAGVGVQSWGTVVGLVVMVGLFLV